MALHKMRNYDSQQKKKVFFVGKNANVEIWKWFRFWTEKRKKKKLFEFLYISALVSYNARNIKYHILHSLMLDNSWIVKPVKAH